MADKIKILKHFEKPKGPGDHYRLVCLNGKNKGIAYYLPDRRVVMGRSDKADIRVLDLKSSREHAEVIKVGKDFVVTDLGSQNGVVVNDLKIKQHVLNLDDKLIIGQTVYRFQKIVVKPEDDTAIKEKDKIEKGDEEFVDEEFEEKKSKLTPVLMIVAVIGIALILFTEDPAPVKEKQRTSANYTVGDVADPFIASLQEKRKEDKESKKKLNTYFRKGLREFREGNYFRAISEFESALSWSPNDALAQFYLRKTKEALDQSIQDMFVKAKRDEESLKYLTASVSYCGIIRLLHRYPEDERYKNAEESLKQIEGKLGLDEGELNCEKVGEK